MRNLQKNLATDLQILKNGANIWGSPVEPGVEAQYPALSAHLSLLFFTLF